MAVPAGLVGDVRGLGLMVGFELCHRDGRPACDAVCEIVRVMLDRGVLILPEGEHGNVLAFTPPLVISQIDLERAVGALEDALAQLGSA